MPAPHRRGTPSCRDPRGALAQIRREHEALRGDLDEIESLLAQVGADVPEAIERLRHRGLALYDRLRDHIAQEERVLPPVLRARGADGARRARILEREHEEQRELLAFLSARLVQRPRPAELVVRELRSFLDYLREDMAHEDALLREESEG